MLEMMIRAVRAVNTIGGLQTFNIAITCSVEETLSITDSFTQCGVSNYELGFIKVGIVPHSYTACSLLWQQ